MVEDFVNYFINVDRKLLLINLSKKNNHK